MAVFLALAAAFGWGSSDYAGGVATRRSSAVPVVILTYLVATAVLVLFALNVPVPRITGANLGGHVWSFVVSIGRPGLRSAPASRDLVRGAAAGVSGGLGAMLLYRAFARGAIAVVAPITAAGAAAVPVLWGLVKGEPLTVVTTAALLLAFVAIVLVSSSGAINATAAGEETPGHAEQPSPVIVQPSPHALSADERLARLEAEVGRLCALIAPTTRSGQGTRPRKNVAWIRDRFFSQPGVPDALLAGLGFGGFFVLLDGTTPTAGLWPLIAARAASVTMFGIGALGTSTPVLPCRGSRLAALCAGLLDAAAAMCFLAAIHTGMLSMVAVLSSLYPGVTVVLARALTKERLASRQLTGLVCAGIAAALFALN